jgi:hypothetical protein
MKMERQSENLAVGYAIHLPPKFAGENTKKRRLQVKMPTINPFWKLQRKINQICKNFTM